jgi:hypothetical protein
MYAAVVEVGTKRMACAWLEEENITLSPEEKAKFMKSWTRN